MELESVVDLCRRNCARCGHSSDWHSFTDEENRDRDVTSEDAVFSCNGPAFIGCDAACPDMVDPPGWRAP